MNLTLDDYWMGRDKSHASDLTPDIEANAIRTVQCLNSGIALYVADGGTYTPRLNSGWRPPSINATTPGAAQHSAHLSAQAGDLSDTLGAELALWSLRNRERLIKVGVIGMERPESTIVRSNGVITARWVHWQTRPVGSGVFVFWPTEQAYKDWVLTGDQLMV